MHLSPSPKVPARLCPLPCWTKAPSTACREAPRSTGQLFLPCTFCFPFQLNLFFFQSTRQQQATKTVSTQHRKSGNQPSLSQGGSTRSAHQWISQDPSSRHPEHHHQESRPSSDACLPRRDAATDAGRNPKPVDHFWLNLAPNRQPFVNPFGSPSIFGCPALIQDRSDPKFSYQPDVTLSTNPYRTPFPPNQLYLPFLW